MRYAALIILLATATASADVPPIEDAIAQAARDKKLLVIELGAVWCKPCVWFEQNVLPDRTVIAELAKVTFVRYDVDTPIGNEVSARYHVGGLPTFLVLDAQGGETFRATGFPRGKQAVAWFLELLRTGRAAKSPIEELRAKVAAHTDDLALRLKLGHALRAAGQDDDATAEYTAVLTAETVDAQATAEAEAALEELAAVRRRILDAVKDATSFVAKHPASPLTSQRLALLAMARGMDASELDRNLAAHLAAVRASDRPDAIRAALVANRPLLARSALAGWSDLDRDTAALLTAELAIAEAKSADATRLVASVCKTPPAGFERWCLDLLGAMRSGATQVPGVERMRDLAVATLHDLRQPGERTQLGLQHLDADAGNAIARALLAADRTCSALAGKHPRVFLRIELAAAGGTPRLVDVQPDDDVQLASCIRNVVATTRLPAVTGEARVSTMLVFAGAQERYAHVPDSMRIDHGGVVYVASRTAPVRSYALAADAIFDLARFSQLRLTATAELEGGRAESADTDKTDTLYAARALVGLGYVPAPGVAISLAAGIGKSKYGSDVPAAIEVPAELRLRVTRRSMRLHTWLRATYLHDAGMRAPDTTSALASSDEVAFGVGMSVPASRDIRLFAGFVYEDRDVGSSTTFVIGVPIGDFF